MFTLAEIKPMLSGNAYKTLSADNGEAFTPIEARACEIVNINTGIDTAVSPRPTNLDGLAAAFAWICEYLVSIRFDSASEQYLIRVKEHYDLALRILESFKEAPRSEAKKAVLKEIKGLYS